MDDQKITSRNCLAIERTRLANECTFLAVGTCRLIYVRSKMRQFHKNASSTSTEKLSDVF